jgi:hypothetical protein
MTLFGAPDGRKSQTWLRPIRTAGDRATRGRTRLGRTDARAERHQRDERQRHDVSQPHRPERQAPHEVPLDEDSEDQAGMSETIVRALAWP